MGKRSDFLRHLDNAFIFQNGIVHAFGVQCREFAAIFRIQTRGAIIGLPHIGFQLEIVRPGIEIAQIPYDLFRAGTFGSGFSSHDYSLMCTLT